MKNTICLALALVLLGCANTSTIQPVNSSKSEFEGAVFSGESATISDSTPGSIEYRIFHQGATGFVSVQTVRMSAEKRAVEFCERQSKVMKPLRETTSKPPHILGNFPKIEIVFECVEKTASTLADSDADPRYTKLLNLKKLLDDGALTQQEFEVEKKKILGQP